MKLRIRLLVIIMPVIILFSMTSCDEQSTPFTTIYGRTIHLSDFRGKTVIVPVFASWCIHCQRELPRLNKLRNDRKDSVVVIGVGSDKEEDIKKLIEKLKIDFPVVKLEKEQIEENFGKVNGFPTAFIFNEKGELIQTVVGEKPEGEFEKILDNIHHKVTESDESCE